MSEKDILKEAHAIIEKSFSHCVVWLEDETLGWSFIEFGFGEENKAKAEAKGRELADRGCRPVKVVQQRCRMAWHENDEGLSQKCT